MRCRMCRKFYLTIKAVITIMVRFDIQSPTELIIEVGKDKKPKLVDVRYVTGKALPKILLSILATFSPNHKYVSEMQFQLELLRTLNDLGIDADDREADMRLRGHILDSMVMWHQLARDDIDLGAVSSTTTKSASGKVTSSITWTQPNKQHVRLVDGSSLSLVDDPAPSTPPPVAKSLTETQKDELIKKFETLQLKLSECKLKTDTADKTTCQSEEDTLITAISKFII